MRHRGGGDSRKAGRLFAVSTVKSPVPDAVAVLVLVIVDRWSHVVTLGPLR